MRTLFLRIFVSFWVIQSILIAIALLHAPMHPDNVRSHFLTRIQVSVLTAAKHAITEKRLEGKDAYLRAVQEFQDDSSIQLWVLGPDGKELADRTIPAETLRQTHRTDVKLVMRSSDGNDYVAYGEFPESIIPPFQGIDSLFHILIGIAVSGVICYWLARRLTRPIDDLRRAAQSIAKGQLSARAAPQRSRDQISQLVTDFNIMADRLQQTIDAQKQLVADISHELRSPLARLSVALDLARARAGDQAKSALDRIQLESGRLNEMIGRILALAKLSAGKPHLEKECVTLAEVLREIVADADFEARAKQTWVALTVAPNAEAAAALAYPPLLRSALENVIRNAIAYTSPGTPVEVEQSVTDRVVLFRVRDHGLGVSEDELTKLFLPFYRVDNSRTRSTGGTGLGLAIASRSIALHMGTIWAENAKDDGLIVTMSIPLGCGEAQK